MGVATVLLAKSMGLTVLGLSRSASKGEKLKELGADAVFSPDDRESILIKLSGDLRYGLTEFLKPVVFQMVLREPNPA